MVRFSLGVVLVLLILVQPAPTQARLDRCNFEPRIRISRHYSHPYCNDAQANRSKSLLIDVPRIHGNPYHALYEVAWAVSYYIQNCIRKPHWQFEAPNTFLRVQVNYEMNLTRCEHEPSDEEYKRWEQPSWGSCMLLAVARRAGIPVGNIEVVPPWKLTSTCHTAVVEFPPRFRSLTYHVGKRPRTKKQKKQLLNAEKVDSTLHQMQQDVLKAYNVRLDQKPNKVNILLYDRRDRRPYPLKRKWISAQSLEERLRNDRRVSVKYMDELPKSLAEQARLFHTTDILVAPHGAAMANTVFMKKTSHVFEIWKCCKDEVRLDPDKPLRWTGWHAGRIGLKLSYFQCHRPNEALSVSELRQLTEQESNGSDQWCSLPWVDVEMNYVYKQVRRAVAEHSRRKGLQKPFMLADFSMLFELMGLAVVLTAFFGVRLSRKLSASASGGRNVE